MSWFGPGGDPGGTGQDGREVLLTAGLEARRCADGLAVEVETLTSRLTELRGSWGGADAAAFAEVVERWQGTQEQVQSALAEIEAALPPARGGPGGWP